MKKVVLSLVAASFLGACATPTVVQSRQPQDEALNCSQLAQAYAEADNYEKNARDERGVTGKNTAAVLLFWPALIGTYMNTEDAIKAARDRKDHLYKLQQDKKCNK
ncbi:MAG: hypothetical protein JNJ55_08615 [Betaproteobacteria bacterium]|nr:hypothetical protein [Betaproteobacteria bacterium]